MNRDHIRAVGQDHESPDQIPLESPVGDFAGEDAQDEEWIEAPHPGRSNAILLPFLFVAAILAWTAFFFWTYRGSMLAGASSQEWIAWSMAWSLPVLLILTIWLLVLRHSTREAARFGDAARLLSHESQRLEERLLTVNRELSLARDFLTEQSRELEYLGRSAADRISEHADRLQGLVRDNGSQVDAIAGVSATALENMDRLRGDLPVIANSARDVANRIGSAGQVAQDNLTALVTGFERLNMFGEASERQVATLGARLDVVVEDMTERLDQIEGVATARFSAIRDNSEALRADLDSREVDALAAIHARAEMLRAELAEQASARNQDEDAALAALATRIATLRSDAADTAEEVRRGEEAALAAWSSQVEALRSRLVAIIEEVTRIDAQSLENSQRKLQTLVDEAEAVERLMVERDGAFDDRVARRRADLTNTEEAALAALSEKVAAFDRHLADVREEQASHLIQFGERSDALGERIGQLARTVAEAADQGRNAERAIGDAIARLSERLAESRESLSGTDVAVRDLTDKAVRLLEMIKASASHSAEDLPDAIEAFRIVLVDLEARTAAMRDALADADRSGTDLGETVATAEHRSREATAALESFAQGLSGTIADQAAALDGLTERLATIESDNARIAGHAQVELRNAIALLQDEATTALSGIETQQADRIRALAKKVGEASAAAIDAAVQDRAATAIGSLDEASARASEASREAARHLHDQLARVNELAGNIESRVAQARERAEERVDNDFSRRVALITESLNSNAIDIGKALSTEVTDTAWTSYLRGDRGIFTRRAVRLLDNTQAREIAELYDQEPDFREHVSRYIHDFEAMLRMLLSTRDGHALGVTMLSSDIGKLYVTLAQAIERLRE